VLLVVGDFDVNGRDDLAALNSSEMLWYSVDLSNCTQIGGAAVSLVASDVDGNGRDDLVGRNSASEIGYTRNVFDTSVSSWTMYTNVLLASLATRPS
jgi:hypothetical protein